jgi:hypothetical protein
MALRGLTVVAGSGDAGYTNVGEEGNDISDTDPDCSVARPFYPSNRFESVCLGQFMFATIFELFRRDCIPQRLRRECIFDLLQHQKHAVLHGSAGSLERLHHPPLHPAQACGLDLLIVSPVTHCRLHRFCAFGCS